MKINHDFSRPFVKRARSSNVYTKSPLKRSLRTFLSTADRNEISFYAHFITIHMQHVAWNAETDELASVTLGE